MYQVLKDHLLQEMYTFVLFTYFIVQLGWLNSQIPQSSNTIPNQDSTLSRLVPAGERVGDPSYFIVLVFEIPALSVDVILKDERSAT